MNHVIKRLGMALFTIFAVVSLSFGLIRLLPGGPMSTMMAEMQQGRNDMTVEEMQQRIAARTNIDPSATIYEQYFEYLTSIFQGDFGTSIIVKAGTPVADILGSALPWTIYLMASALLLQFLIGVVWGAFMAYREGSNFDVASTGLALFLNSTPYYVVALLFIVFLGYRMQLFPTSGRYAPGVTPGFNPDFLVSVVYHGILPIASMVITATGGWALSMRGNSIRILGEDYLRVARLRGLSENRIATRYVARNAILPMYTGLMIAIGIVFGGSIILEQIFSYPGIGYYMINAISARDYPLMMGAFILVTSGTVVGILFADLTYGWIDPRAGGGASRESY